MKRRQFLKAAAVAPLGAQVAAQQTAMQAAGISGIGMAGSGAQCAQGIGSDSPVKLTSWVDWLKAGGERELKEQAQEVSSLDPDIVVLVSVSLCAKIQMQRDRNLRHLMENRKSWFERQMEKCGFVNWYD